MDLPALPEKDSLNSFRKTLPADNPQRSRRMTISPNPLTVRGRTGFQGQHYLFLSRALDHPGRHGGIAHGIDQDETPHRTILLIVIKEQWQGGLDLNRG